jgi:hypothetical protein
LSTSIRGIDEDTFKEFKLEAQKRDKTVGEAVNEAMLAWLDSKDKISLDEMDAWDWGEGTEELSEEYEDELYGETA